MKFVIALVAIVAAASAWKVPNLGRGELYKDLQEFVDLIPTNKLVQLFLQYAAEDAEVQRGLAYVQTEDFKQLVQENEQIPEVIAFYNYVYSAGVDIYYLVNRLHEYIHIPKLTPPSSFYGITGGYKGLVADVKKLMPNEQLKALYYKKVETSPAFKELVERLSSKEFQTIVDTLYANPRFLYILKRANEAGLDVKAVREVIQTMKCIVLFAAVLVIGVSSNQDIFDNSWEFNELDKDIYDFIKLMPVNEILKLSVKYRNDPEIQRTLRWVSGGEFHTLLANVEKLQEFKDLVLFIQEAGYNEIREIQIYHALTGMPDFVPPHRYEDELPQGYANGGFAKYLEDLIDLIPKGEIERLHNKKSVDSPAFIKFHNAIHSAEYKQLKNALQHTPEYQLLLQRTKANGLDIQAFENFKYELLGFLRKGMKLIFAFIAALIVFETSAVPFKSNQWDIMKTLAEAFDENNLELNYLDRDFIDFIKLIPMNKLVTILQKYENDPEILSSYDYLRSEEFHNLVYAVEDLREHRKLVRILQEAGYNKIRELKMIHEALGMKEYVPKKRRSLDQQQLEMDNGSKGGLSGLFNEIIAILPVKEIKELHEKKLIESQPFAKFNLYVSSSRFRKILTNLTTTKQYKQMAQKALEHGVDLALFIVVGAFAVPLNNDKAINSLNGNRSNVLENFLDAFNGNNSGITPLDRDFLDFAKLIPIDKLRSIAYKYANDSGVRHSLRFVLSEKFHNLVYAVEAIPEHNDLVRILEEAGFSAIRNIKLIHRALGMKDYVPPPLSTQELKNLEPKEGGLSGFIKEYIEILPVNEIKELHQRKLKESQAFARFDSYVRSPRFREILRALGATKEQKELLEVSLQNGIDFHLIMELNQRVLGYKPMKYVFTIFVALVVAGVSAIPLNDNMGNDEEMRRNALDRDIIDFLKLIPVDELRPIMDKYANDSKLEASTLWLLTDEFHQLVYAVEALPEHQKYVRYLQESGFDKIRELKIIHQLLGMKDYVPPSLFLLSTISQYNLVDSEGGWSGYIKEFVEVLPVKEIKALHNKKLKESAAFKKFSSYVLSEEMSQLSKDLAKQQAFKEFLQKTLEHGIDYYAFVDLALRILGFRP
ncbi:PREDICTED: uncharacterized protein LOC107069346 [Polistes dominula]|uniref:Uncharacterized protein LOC107069346 n=1 Tax=Polistes dominula TaxID=743375 RepID=A0ABM1IPD6_POLDO|nr:PREDICTED: uncharacterized protein LOC107069346 [Polistes dominula]